MVTNCLLFYSDEGEPAEVPQEPKVVEVSLEPEVVEISPPH